VSSDIYSKIRLEFSQLHKLLEIYHSLLEQVKTQEPNEIEGTAAILFEFSTCFSKQLFLRSELGQDKKPCI
jgi:hypothetical protein